MLAAAQGWSPGACPAGAKAGVTAERQIAVFPVSWVEIKLKQTPHLSQESEQERMAALEAEWRRRAAEQASAAEVTLSAAAAAGADARKVSAAASGCNSILLYHRALEELLSVGVEVEAHRSSVHESALCQPSCHSAACWHQSCAGASSSCCCQKQPFSLC